MIAKNENTGAVTFKIDCTAYVVLNMLIEQISQKPVKVVFLGRLAFVLDTIVLENYNNKPFLNIYQIHTSNSTGFKTKDISTVWSSLSMEEFSNFNIVDFSLQRAAPDNSNRRHYSMLILAQLNNDNITAYYFNDIVVERYQDEDSRPLFNLYQNR
jgi:hypothetical protein